MTQALKRNEPIEIMAIGSGSTVGDQGGAGGPAFNIKTPGASFPYKMVAAMRTMRPAVNFNLTVAGGRNMTAEEMLAVIRHELSMRRYHLVLWQTGTVEAVRGMRADALRETLRQGIALTSGAKADMVLIDPLFSRFLRASDDLAPYESVLQQAGTPPAAHLFHRLGITQLWASNGQVDPERAAREQREKTIGLLNTCIGHALALYVLTGTP